MKKNNRRALLCFTALLTALVTSAAYAEDQEDYKILREIVINEFKKEVPAEQGSEFADILRRFKAKEKKVAIILGACLDQGTEVDDELFRKFQEKQTPVSLFVDQGWLKKNSDKLKKITLSKNVTLENHGLFCRPLSVAGKGMKGHPGTADVDEAFEEIEKNAREIEQFSGRLPRFFASGFDSYDDVSLKIVSVLGYTAVQGDLKLRARDVESDSSLKDFLGQVNPGSIILIPANRPGSAAVWIPKLLEGLERGGYQVVALDDAVNAEEESR